MPTYNIEGDVDFYAMLNEAVEDDCISDDKKTCLITNMPLDNTRIQMSCGHEFNYEPLFNDIVNHKKTFNVMERNRLRTGHIRCPYCRNIQSQLLPYIENDKYPKIHGVNFICPVQTENEKKHGGRSCCDWESCMNNYAIKYSPILKKSFCIYHTKMGMKALLNQKKLEVKKAKEDAKLAKIKAREDAKIAKEDAKIAKIKAKEDAKIAKLQAKEDAKIAKLQGKNVKINVDKCANNPIVTTDVNSVISGGCNWVMVSGKNKGKLCGSKIKENNCCSRHIGKTILTIKPI